MKPPGGVKYLPGGWPQTKSPPHNLVSSASQAGNSKKESSPRMSPVWTTSLLAGVVVVLALTITPTSGLRFLGESENFARYPKWNPCQNASVSFEFRTRKASSLLLYTDDNGRYDYLQIALSKGAIRLLFNYVSSEKKNIDIEATTAPLNDGQWHRVEIRRRRVETILYVDGTQTSKASVGSDAEFGLDPAQINHVYFGGLPSNYRSKLARDQGVPQPFMEERFSGDIRNILYFNCSCIPVRASMVDGQGVSRDPPEACEVRDPCPADCPCVSVDDGSGCECNYRRECLKDILASYHLPLDEIVGKDVINPSGLDSVVEGGPVLTAGVKDKALLINGRNNQWLRVTGSSHRQECMGDLSRCDKGYYMGLWMQFKGTGYQRGVYLSNGGHSTDSHGVALLYSKGRLGVVFKSPDGREWRASSHEVLEERWYHVAATWAADKGLYLYINGDKAGHHKNPTTKQATVNGTRYNSFYIGRANDNTGTERLGQVMVDDFHFESAFKDEKEVRESAIYHYYMPMDAIKQDRLEGKGIQGQVYGAASSVDGKIGNAVLLSGGREYVDLGDVSSTCLGDLNLCQYGFYASMWLIFNKVDGGRRAIVSSPSLGLHQDGTTLTASVRDLRQYWEARYAGLTIGTWYFVEMSYKPGEGLSLFVDRRRVDFQGTPSYRPPEPLASMNMFLGSDGPRGTRYYPAATVDELDVFYADKGTLESIDFIERDRPKNEHFDMDSIRQGRLVHDTMVVSALGRPQVVKGKVNSAVTLDGRTDALDFGERNNDCFGNLDLCPHGVTVSLWLRPDTLQERAHYLSTGHNGLTVLYKDRKLQVMATTTSKTWEVSTADFAPNKWHFLEVSFHPDRGLHLYIGGQLVAESLVPQPRDHPAPASYDLDRFYLGRGNVDMTKNKHGGGTYDELDFWYADRDYLQAHGFIQRSQPDSIIVPFEESPDQTRILHSTLDIRLIGRPRLVPGKVGNALELSGRGQYADLGMLSHTCFGNLARCYQGITLSAWMRFRNFENNMVFLSTGKNGLFMLYKDGYIQVSANGQDVVTTPRLDRNRWYYVEMSWHPSHGLRLYKDNAPAGEAPSSYMPTNLASDSGHFYIGRANEGDVPEGGETTGNFDIDELEVWSGRREDLLAFGYIERDTSPEDPIKLGYEVFPMDSVSGDRINHPTYVIILVNGARLVPGRQGNAVELLGRGQYVDLGPHRDACLGNLDLCSHGLTISLWLRPNSLVENTHFLSSPSYSLFYEDGQLKAEFYTADRTWTVSTPRFSTDHWQRVTLSWHAKRGLSIYVDDELQASNMGQERLQRDEPTSERVYIGRNQADTRLTADVLVDHMQVWYDYLDQLRVTGQYEVEVIPRQITFDNVGSDGTIVLRDRRLRLIGEIRLIPGLGQDSRAIFLDGRSQYVDLGERFICGGDLESCAQGTTLRFALNPNRLQDGMYFLDSWPVKLYYKDGRLVAEMQTSTRVWTVDSPEFREGQWSRVELSWHPTRGLVMYINGKQVDYETYPRERPSVTNTDWRTFLGRPLRDSDGIYANVLIDNLESYNAYSTFIPPDPYLTLIRNQPPIVPQPALTTRPPGIIIGEPGVVTTQRPSIVVPGTESRRTTTIIRLDGASYVRFNFDRLPADYLIRTPEEEFSFWFLTDRPEGLIWYHEEQRRNLYIAIKDGHIVFGNDPKSGQPHQQVTIGQRYNKRFDDYSWHRLKIKRDGRRIQLTVDDSYQEEYIFSEDIQFLSPAEVWLGGTPNTYERTNGNIKSNFNGGVAEVVYMTTYRQGTKTFKNEVNLITQLSSGTSTGQVNIVTIPPPFWTEVQPPMTATARPPPTRPPPPPTPSTTPKPALTAITIVQTGVSITIPTFALKPTSSVSFNFKTINQNGLLLFAGNARSQFMAVELVDGKLYFVRNFGRREVRTPFSQRIVADGQNHEVEIRFYVSHVDLRVDDVRERLDLISGETLPPNLGALYVAGYPYYDQLPWSVYTRQSYLGCLSELRIDNRFIDFEAEVQNMIGFVNRGCQAMPQECAIRRPCREGICQTTMTRFICDCSRTAFRGEFCNLDAWTALFNGTIYAQLDFSKTLVSHSDDISMRFRTPLRNGLLFETFARGSNVFLRCSLEDGRIKVETNLGGELRTLYSGKDLNDLQWHTVNIQRRGGEMEVWVDNEPHATASLAGTGYYFNIDQVYLGGKQGLDDRYIGYIQNFHLNELDLLEQLQGRGIDINTFVSLPPLIYKPVTFTQYVTFVELPALRMPLSMVLHFMFKTKEPNGVLLLATGKNQDFLAAELFEGNLHIHIATGRDQPMRVSSQQIVNNGQWHAVTLQRTADKNQFLLTLDGVMSSVSYASRDGLDLQGPLYIGGAPESLLQKDYIKNAVSSRAGFLGCLASVDLNGQVPDLGKFAQEQGITLYDTCMDTLPSGVCKKTTCKNFGKCIDNGAGGFVCDCSMSSHIGTTCENEPFGYRFQNFSRPGLLVYTLTNQPTSQQEEIAFGIMTNRSSGIIARFFSESIGDFIEFRLHDGYIYVDYDTIGAGGKQTISQLLSRLNDTQYHIVRFIRSPEEATLYVDNLQGVTNVHTSLHKSFDRLSKIYVGGIFGKDNEIINGYDGIIGGLYINGLHVFTDSQLKAYRHGDVVEADRPFKITGGTVIVTLTTTIAPIVTPTPVPTKLPPIVPIPVLPPDIGGGGVNWKPGLGGGETVIFPGGDGGTAVVVPGPSSAAGGPVVSALVAAPPPLPAAGPRAGAVVGTILGLMALLSSMMWAFYKCKPGWCACIKPPAEAPLAISSPRLTSGSNKGAVTLASGGVGAGAGGSGAAGSGAIVAGGGGSTTAAGSSFSNFYMGSSSSAAGGGAGGAGGASATGYNSNFQSSTTQMRSADLVDTGPLSAASIQSYHYEGGSGTADYDLATGVHAGYQSNTLSAPGGSVSGSLGGAGYSASTMQSSYNYSVKTVRTVSGQQQMIGYAGANQIGVPPGALGEEVRVDCCLMTADGHSVVTGSSLGPPQVWDMQTGELLRIMQGETVGSTMLHLACNDRLLVGAINADLEVNQSSVPKGVHNYLLQIWDFTTGRALEMADLEVCSALTLMSDNDKVVFAKSDKFGGGTNVVVWDLLGNQPIKHMRFDAPVGNNDYVHYLALSQNDRYVIAGFTNSFDQFAEFVIFDMTLTSYTVSDPSILRLDANPDCTAVLPRDEAVTGLRNGDLVIWSLRTGQPSRQLLSGSGRHAHAREIKAVARSEDSKYLVSASADGSLKIWDVATERHINTLTGHGDEVWCCAISPDNEIIVSGSRDRTIRLWRLKSGTEICSFNAGVDIFHVTMSRDKSTIVALGDKNGARKLIMLQVVRTKVRRQVSS